MAGEVERRSERQKCRFSYIVVPEESPERFCVRQIREAASGGGAVAAAAEEASLQGGGG